MSQRKISVIIVTYNSERHIYDCLSSLFHYNDIGEGLEVIIVDNNSNNAKFMSSEIFRIYGERVKIIQNDKNGGYGQGNNVGIKNSFSNIVMIMNPDVRLSEPIFKRVLKEFKSDEHLVLYGFTQRTSSGAIGRSTSILTKYNPYIAEPLRYFIGKLNLYFSKYMIFSGACFFINKIAFKNVGYFDENIFMYNEEEDIHIRLSKDKKSRIKYDRDISYTHLHESVKDYTLIDHIWQKRNIQSLIYLNNREGISLKQTIKRERQRTHLTILVEKIKIILGRGNESRLKYYTEWEEELKVYNEKS